MTPSMETWLAPAKINLFLRIVRRREDGRVSTPPQSYNRAHGLSILAPLVLGGWLVDSLAANACEGCMMSRIQASNPAIGSWGIIIPCWFVAQVAAIAFLGKWTRKTLVGIGANLLLAATIGRFFYVDYWPTLLWIFPAGCLIFSGAHYWRKSRPRRYLVATLSVGLVSMAALSYTYSVALREPLIERILRLGASAGAREILDGLPSGSPQSIQIRREILRRGDIQKEGNGYYGLGESLLMKQAADWLLINGDIETDVPLIIDSIDRLDQKCKEFGVKESLHHLGLPVAELFMDKYGVSMRSDASADEMRHVWQSILKRYSDLDTKARKVMLSGGFTIRLEPIDKRTQQPISELGSYELWGEDAHGNRNCGLRLYDTPFRIEKVPAGIKRISLEMDGYAPYVTDLPPSDDKGVISLGKIPLIRGKLVVR